MVAALNSIRLVSRPNPILQTLSNSIESTYLYSLTLPLHYSSI